MYVMENVCYEGEYDGDNDMNDHEMGYVRVNMKWEIK